MKEDSSVNNCLCCLKSVISDSGNSCSEVINTITACLSIQIPSPVKCSACSECVQRLKEIHRFKSRMVDTFSKLANIYKKDNAPLKLKDYDDIDPVKYKFNDTMQDKIDSDPDITTVQDLSCPKRQFSEKESFQEVPFRSFGQDNSSIYQHPNVDFNIKNKDVSFACESAINYSPSTETEQRSRPDVRVNLINVEHYNLHIDKNNTTVDLRPGDVESISENEMKYLKSIFTINNAFSNIDNVPTVFKLFHDILKRTRERSGGQNFTCTLCPKSYVKKSHLVFHMKSHSDVRDFKCSLCVKSFRSKSELNRHTQRHGARNFKCDTCSKAFLLNGDLNVHLKTHDEVREFKCTHCPKSFVSRNNLNYHVRRHDVTRNFKCTLCSKAFLLNGDLAFHLKTHSEERGFKCTLCPGTFKFKRNLNDHIKRHSGVKNFVCTLCSKAFVSRSDLVRHLRKTHSEEMEVDSPNVLVR